MTASFAHVGGSRPVFLRPGPEEPDDFPVQGPEHIQRFVENILF